MRIQSLDLISGWQDPEGLMWWYEENVQLQH